MTSSASSPWPRCWACPGWVFLELSWQCASWDGALVPLLRYSSSRSSHLSPSHPSRFHWNVTSMRPSPAAYSKLTTLLLPRQMRAHTHTSYPSYGLIFFPSASFANTFCIHIFFFFFLRLLFFFSFFIIIFLFVVDFVIHWNETAMGLRGSGWGVHSYFPSPPQCLSACPTRV